MGFSRRFGAGPNAGGVATREFDFLSCDISASQELLISDGIRGTRSAVSQQATTGVKPVGGGVILEPRPDDLDFWLPYILGAEEATDVFALAETLPELCAVVDNVVKVYTYAGCKVNTARFSGGANQKMQLALDLQGKTESEGAAASFPSIANTLSLLQPYTFQQGVLTLADTTTYEFNNVEIAINNNLILDRYNNSETRTEIPCGPRVVTLACDLPFTADELARRAADATGIAATLKYTNGTRSLLFTFANLKKPLSPIQAGAKNAELTLRCQFQAFATQAGDGTLTRELVVTNDSTA
jgi:hypothetical protein